MQKFVLERVEDKRRWCCWRHERVPGGDTVMVIVHGLGEHAQRYFDLIQTEFSGLADCIVCYDQRGSGESAKLNGEKHGQMGTMEELVNDLSYIIQKEAAPFKKFILVNKQVFMHSV